MSLETRGRAIKEEEQKLAELPQVQDDYSDIPDEKYINSDIRAIVRDHVILYNFLCLIDDLRKDVDELRTPWIIKMCKRLLRRRR